MSATETNRRILIVDDNRAIHDDFRKVLMGGRLATSARLDELEAALFDTPAPTAATEFTIDSAYQGQDALARVTAAKLEGRPYALAFVDMRMPPGWDGLETIERLWAEDPRLQIVICSAFTDYSWDDFRARLGERDDLLVVRKPFDMIEVAQCAHALTTKWTLAQRAAAHLLDLEGAVRARTLELEEANARLRDERRHIERIEGELRLAQKLEAVGQLAAGIAHEINTPLQYVGDSLAFVSESTRELVQLAGAAAGGADPVDADLAYAREELPIALDRMQEGLRRVTRIVQAMKELSHPGQREMAPADLNRALHNALEVTASSYRDVATLELDVEPLPPVVCHLTELNQVFLNLIVNASQAMEDARPAGAAPGVLRVKTRTGATHVTISIADTGGGIPEAARERLFDPFFTTKEVGRGSGQGLAIARSIVVDRHGGTIQFESTLGAGTTFHVRLPILGAELPSPGLSPPGGLPRIAGSRDMQLGGCVSGDRA